MAAEHKNTQVTIRAVLASALAVSTTEAKGAEAKGKQKVKKNKKKAEQDDAAAVYAVAGTVMLQGTNTSKFRAERCTLLPAPQGKEATTSVFLLLLAKVRRDFHELYTFPGVYSVTM